MSLDVLIVEDDDFTRITLSTSLTSIPHLTVDSCSSVAEALRRAEESTPRVALIDLHLGSGPNGLDLARKLRALNPAVGIIILTSYDDPRLLGEQPEFMPSGLVYLTKRQITDINVLLDAINVATKSKVTRQRNPMPGPSRHLNKNQLAILRLIALGKSNSEIARIRGVSEKAVEGTIARIIIKLNLDRSPATNQRVHIARVYFRALGLNIDDEISH